MTTDPAAQATAEGSGPGAAASRGGALRRMVRRPPPARRAAPDGDGLRQAAPRAVARLAGLSVALGEHALDTLARDELGSALPDGALVLRLSPRDRDGAPTPAPDGLAWLDADLFAALVERCVTGALRPAAPEPRPATSLDAVICRELIDMLCAAPGVADGEAMRAGDHLADPDVAVSLPDIPFRVMRLTLGLRHGAAGGGGRGGQIGLALPDPPPPPEVAAVPGVARPDLLGCGADLRVVLQPLVLTWERIVRLSPGDLIDLPGDALETVRVESLDGASVAGGRLGRMGEARAVRLSAATPAREARPEEAHLLGGPPPAEAAAEPAGAG